MKLGLKIPSTSLEMPTIVHNVHTHLTLYKRIANAKSEEELRELRVEMTDRFGLLPEPTKNLFCIMELKLKADALGIRKIDAGPKSVRPHRI